MIPQRFGRSGSTTVARRWRELLQPHGFKERRPPLENVEHDELNRADNDDAAERGEIQL